MLVLLRPVGLGTGARVPLSLQVQTFERVLEVLADLPRMVSIHSYQATGMVLAALRCRPVAVPVLHWWTGSSAETREAVALGCYFSIHSQVARNSKFRVNVPRERILVESDHSYADPPAAIPCRVQWVEYLVAQQYRVSVEDLRRLVWANFATIVEVTHVASLLPRAVVEILGLL